MFYFATDDFKLGDDDGGGGGGDYSDTAKHLSLEHWRACHLSFLMKPQQNVNFVFDLSLVGFSVNLIISIATTTMLVATVEWYKTPCFVVRAHAFLFLCIYDESRQYHQQRNLMRFCVKVLVKAITTTKPSAMVQFCRPFLLRHPWI